MDIAKATSGRFGRTHAPLVWSSPLLTASIDSTTRHQGWKRLREAAVIDGDEHGQLRGFGSSVRITRAGTPAKTTLSPKERVTTAPAATTTLLPNVTPGLMVA